MIFLVVLLQTLIDLSRQTGFDENSAVVKIIVSTTLFWITLTILSVFIKYVHCKQTSGKLWYDTTILTTSTSSTITTSTNLKKEEMGERRFSLQEEVPSHIFPQMFVLQQRQVFFKFLNFRYVWSCIYLLLYLLLRTKL